MLLQVKLNMEISLQSGYVLWIERRVGLLYRWWPSLLRACRPTLSSADVTGYRTSQLLLGPSQLSQGTSQLSLGPSQLSLGPSQLSQGTSQLSLERRCDLLLQVVAQSIESLPANSFFTSLATLDTEPLDLDLNKLALGKLSTIKQCCGSMTFWGGSGSGSCYIRH
jgi:hypothetical protein